MTELQQLIKALEAIEASEVAIPTYEDEYGAGMLLEHDHELVQKASGIACGVLIGDGGQCDWDNIRALTVMGYSVYAGERDSFGWLSGCIRTKVGVVVYG
jgi:hypothetical protein